MVTSKLEYLYSDAKTKLLIECQDFFSSERIYSDK